MKEEAMRANQNIGYIDENDIIMNPMIRVYCFSHNQFIGNQ